MSVIVNVHSGLGVGRRTHDPRQADGWKRRQKTQRWLAFLAEYRAEHPYLSFREAKANAEPLFAQREAERDA